MDSEIDSAPVGLADLLVWIRSHWLVILAPAGVCLILGIFYLLVAAPRYKVEALLAPAEQPGNIQSLSRLASQFGATSLLGMPNENNQNLSDIAVAVLQSRRFVEAFIDRHELLPLLFSGRWDKQTGSWTDDGDVPSLNDGYRSLMDKLSIRKDEVTGFITVTLEWTDAETANRWLTLLIEELNEDIRQREREEATRSLDFLKQELARTDLNEIRQGLYQLSLTELQKLTMANVREEFALKVIDPPSLPDKDDPAGPKKLLVLVGSTVLGLICGFGIALLITAWRLSSRPLKTE